MARLGFNANEVAPSTGNFEPIPEGAEVELHAIEEELKPNSKNTGELLTLTYEVLSGEYAGRKITARMNIAHENPVAQKIGQEELSALCHASGAMQVEDTEELLWKPFRAIVGIEEYTKRDGSTGYGNKIKKYLIEGAESAPPASKPEPTPARQAAPARPAASRPAPTAKPAQGGANLPWKRPAA